MSAQIKKGYKLNMQLITFHLSRHAFLLYTPSHEEAKYQQTFASLFTIFDPRRPPIRRLDRANQTSMPADSPGSDQHHLKIR